MPATASAGVTRGCGSRESGGIYVECGLSDKGIDISNFMLDPVTAFEMDTHRGQEVRERNGTFHLFDHVGAKHYPTAADIYEEVRRHGASRRASPTQNFELLGPDSKMVLVHPRAKAIPVRALVSIERQLGLQNMPAYRQKCMLYRKSMGKDTSHFDCDAENTPACTRFWWLDAGWERPVNRSSPKRGGRPKKLNNLDVRKISSLLEEDGNEMPNEEIAREFGVPESTIYDFVSPDGEIRNLPYEEPDEINSVRGLNFPYPVGKRGDRVRQGTRKVGETGFRTHGGPLEECSGKTGPVDATFESGVVFSLPITSITVIDSPDETADQRLDDLKSRSVIPVTKQPE